MQTFQRIRKHFYLVLLSLSITLLFANFVLIKERPLLFETLENITYDLRLQLTLPNQQHDQVVIIDIDEKSLAAEGQWPWPRDRLASMVNMLFDHYAVAVLGFDIVFAEPDDDPGIETLERLAATAENFPGDREAFQYSLNRLKPSIDRDRQFAAALANRPVVLGFYFQGRQHLHAGSQTGELPFPILPIAEAGLEGLPFNQALGYGANLGLLQENAIAGGFFDNPSRDSDGVIRAIPLLSAFAGNLYESLALATLRVYQDSFFIEPVLSTDAAGNARGLEALRIGQLQVPVNDQAMALVPYLGEQGSFRYVSASDVLQQRIDPQHLAGRIVLVGTTSPGLQDLRNTPVQAVFPGVEVHANMIAGILDGRVRHQPSYSIAIELVTLLGLGLLLSLLLPVLSAAGSILLTLVLLGVVTGSNLYAWQLGLVLPLASTLILIGLLFMLHMAYGFLTETRMKHMITRTFGQYVPPEVVGELAEHPRSLDLRGQNRDMTVLFSDVRGFTSLSEGLSPAELTQVMNAILTPMTRLIHQHNGTIDKYMGDAVMAFWGAPLDDPEHRRHALQAALAMTAEIAEINRQFQTRGWPTIDMGIGLNSGAMNVGNMGSEFRVAYTVLGDAVNLGSRLEGLTKSYGVRIIVSEFTCQGLDDYLFRELDRVRVKGKDHPVTIYEPLCLQDEASEALRQELAKYQQALTAYRAQNWHRAERLFQQLSAQASERKLYPLYLQRVRQFRQHPPAEDWDGVYTFSTK